VSGSHYDPEPTRYDLRTATQHEDDAIAQLALRLDNMLDALEAQAATVASLTRTVTELRTQLETITRAAMTDLSKESHRTEILEGRVTALEHALEKLGAAQAVHAELLQVYRLERGI